MEHSYWKDRRNERKRKAKNGYVKTLSTWPNVEAKELMKTTKSRVEWRAMTANALKEHGI